MEEGEQNCAQLGEAAKEMAKEKSNKSACLNDGKVKIESSEGSLSQDMNIESVNNSSTESVNDATSDSRDACSWRQDNSNSCSGESDALKTTVSHEVAPKIMQPLKLKRGRKPKNFSQLDEMFSADDLKHMEKPFTFGWRRELVYRNTAGTGSRGNMCDVYYFTPDGKKLRSMVEISGFLSSHKNLQVNLTHFSFKRKPLFKEPFEVVRSAGKKLEDVVAKRGPKKQKQLSVCKKATIEPPQETCPLVKAPVKKLSSSDLVKQLATAIRKPQISRAKVTAETVQSPPESVTDSAAQTAVPVKITAAPVRITAAPVRITAPSEPASQPVTVSQLPTIKKTGPKRMRQRSPDWTPEYDWYSTVPVKKRNVEIIKQTEGPISHDDDDDDGSLENIFGTPSKFIASIVRSEPLNIASNLNANRGAVSQDLAVDTCSSATAPVGNCSSLTPPHLLLVASPLSTASSNDRSVCSRDCPGMGGIVPFHPCIKCGQAYHLMCAKVDSNSVRNSLCRNCGRKALESSVRTTSNPSVLQLQHQANIQNLPAVPAALHSMGSLNGPIPSSVVPVSSTLMNTSLLTSPQLLPQVFFIPGPTPSSIPPPPPLASRPQFDAVTFVPLTFNSDVPPPPRLQFCNIPNAGQSQSLPTHPPPPYFLSNHLLLSSRSNSIITELPTRHPLVSLLPSKSVALKTSETSSGVEGVTDVDAICIDPPPRSLLTPISPEAARSSPLSNEISAVPVMEGNVVKQTYKIKNTHKDHPVLIIQTEQCMNSSDNKDKAWCNEPVPGIQQGLDVSALGNQAGPNVLCAVRDLVSQRTRSESVSSDSLDCLPIQFQPLNTTIPVKRKRGRPRKNPVKEVEPVYHETPTEELWQRLENRKSLEDKCSVLKGMLRRPPVGIVRDLEATPSVVLGSGDSVLPDPSAAHLKCGVVPVGAATREKADTQLHPVNNTDASGVIGNKNAPSTISIFELTPQPSNMNSVQTESLLSADASIMPGQAASPCEHPQQQLGTCERKVTRKIYMTSFRVLHGSFPVVMKIFTYLSPGDLLRVSAVCKLWHTLAMQPRLWKYVCLNGIRVRNWDQATQFFHKIGVQTLNFKGAFLQATWGVSSFELWNSIKRTIPTLTQLKELFFQQVPASVLNSITEKMPNLVNVGAEFIIDSEAFTSAPPATIDRTVVKMCHAVEAVTSKRLSAKDAAKLFHVSEKDLIHLAQAAGKLTEDEERAVILCCLRLSHMGFYVQLDTLVCKCQEMFARRFSTTASIPVSDAYVRDLYVSNQPLFTPDIEIASSSNSQQRLNAHYSVLQKLYKSLWPRLTPSASQILAFDLKHFNLGKDHAFNGGRSVSVTVFSTMTAHSTCLPCMVVWPRYVDTTHESLISIVSSHGLAAYHHVYNYFQKILNLVKERPLVILCNGNASLFSEKLITSCVKDSVYFYCVPPGVAKYVFPGFHGGLLHMLKSYVPEEGVNCEYFASMISFLLDKKKQIQQSSRLAFTTSGALPLNSKAPFQYQTYDCKTSQQQAVSLLQPQTINQLKDAVAAGKPLQPQTASEVIKRLLSESVPDDPVTSGTKNNTDKGGDIASKHKTKNNDIESTCKTREKGSLTAKDVMDLKKTESNVANYRKNKENKRKKKNNNEELQENNALLIYDEQESNVDTLCEVPENHLDISDEVHERRVDTASGEVPENHLDVSDEVHERHVDTVSGKMHGNYINAESKKVLQGCVDALSNKVMKGLPVKVAKTCEGRKNKKCSYVQFLARTLLNQARRNMSVKAKRLILSSNGSIQTENDLSIKHTSHDVGQVQACPAVKEVCPREKTDRLLDCSTETGQGHGSTADCEQTPDLARKLLQSGRKCIIKSSDSGSLKAGFENSSSSNILSSTGNSSNGRDETASQTGTETRGIAQGSSNLVRASVRKSDVVVVLQQVAQKEQQSSATVVNNKGVTDSQHVEAAPLGKCRDNRKSSKTIMDAADIEDEFRDRINQSTEGGLATVKPVSNCLSESNHQETSMTNTEAEQLSVPRSEHETSFDGGVSIKKKKKKKHKKQHRMKENIREKSSSDAAESAVKSSGSDAAESAVKSSGSDAAESAVKSSGSDAAESAVKSSGSDAAESAVKSSGSASDNNLPNDGTNFEEMETAEETDKLKQLIDYSLIDHDYIVRYDVSERVDPAAGGLDTVSESADGPDTQAGGISSSIQNLETETPVVDSDDILYVMADENAETLVNSSLCEGAQDTSKCGSSSTSSCSSCSQCSCSSDSSSCDEEESPPTKLDSGHTAEMSSSSDNESSEHSEASDKEVDEDVAESSANSQDDDDAASTTNEDDDSNDSSTDTSDVDEDEEEEEEDDESLCQICMRSVPPHSKDEIIDWVDCDKNCGRWFHVICITRSQAKSDMKSYICPSCRYI